MLAIKIPVIWCKHIAVLAIVMQTITEVHNFLMRIFNSYRYFFKHLKLRGILCPLSSRFGTWVMSKEQLTVLITEFLSLHKKEVNKATFWKKRIFSQWALWAVHRTTVTSFYEKRLIWDVTSVCWIYHNLKIPK